MGGGMTIAPEPAPRFTLNQQDLKQWGRNTLIFLGPALLVLIASAIKVVPQNWQYGTITLYILNILTDILRKFLDGPPQ